MLWQWPIWRNKMETWSVERLRKFDEFCVDTLKIPSIILMENAGYNSATIILEKYSDIKKILILCGKGNNAGDGFVVARHLMNQGINVDVLNVFPDDILSKDASVFYDSLENYNVNICSKNTDLMGYDLVVDAVFGLGFHGELPQKVIDVFNVVNNIDCKKVALDIPSGVQADDCIADLNSFRSDLTITMVAPKKSFSHDFIKSLTGEVEVVSIGVEPSLFSCKECQWRY